MDNKEFKNKIKEFSIIRGFNFAFGGWYKESPECIIVLDLQRSNFCNYYYLNIKVFVQGAFGNQYVVSKKLIKNELGEFDRAQPKEFSNTLNLDVNMDDQKRIQSLQNLYDNFVVPFSKKALSKEGLKELIKNKELILLSAVKKTLGFDDLDAV